MKFATFEEIAYAESILLKNGQHFDQPYIDIIECNETKDIKACPGSGKTTALLAKLVILANRMPLENNQGICVLTHTNVAIDEIKSRLGKKADVLFAYPNFFGTIQSFVDKYLAIPCYEQSFGKKPYLISDEAYLKSVIRSYYSSIGRLKNNNPTLKNKLCNFIAAHNDFWKNTRLSIVDESGLKIKDKNTGNTINIKRPKGIDWIEAEKEEIFNEIINIIKNVYHYYSALSYSDAYLFGNLYLIQRPSIKLALNKRFGYLFVDEMQDTDTHQLNIITKIFKDSETICQYFGDSHQAIFSKVKSENIWAPQNYLPLDTSKRFGNPIAEVLKTVCIEHNPSLTGNPEVNSVKPHLIVFEDPKDVLPKFAELMKTLQINHDGEQKSIWQIAMEDKVERKLDRYRVKAVGWVGDASKQDHENNKFTIGSYHDFEKNAVKKDYVNIDSLKSFLKKHQSADAKYYTNRILDALLQVLHIANVNHPQTNKRFTKSSLQEYLKEKHETEYFELRCKLAKWSQSIHNSEMYSESTYTEIKEYINTSFNPLWSVTNNKYVKQFIENQNDLALTADNSPIPIANIYRWNDIEVELATVHSVKGETHIATLYLETIYQRQHEGNRLEKQLKGKPISKSAGVYEKEALKMAYVGMSRPIHLLCFAIHRSRYKGSPDEYPNWEVINVAES
ncbi:MAG: UvrD-helicase domain-containing protein [Bacteroidales bacterium]